MASNFRPQISTQTNSCLQLVKHVWLSTEWSNQNFVFSPFSISLALGLLASGSNGQTLQQILDFLNSQSVDHLNLVCSQLINSVNKTQIHYDSGGGEGSKLSFHGGVWVDSSSALKTTFKDIASSVYSTKAHIVNFKTQGKEVAEEVNKWVEEETNGLIQNLLSPESIDELTKLVLANAVYFKGSWAQKFNPSNTIISDFHLVGENSSTVLIPFMTNHGSSQFVSCFDDFKVVKLPYKQSNIRTSTIHGCQFSMYIFLPNKLDGLRNLIEKVSSDSGFLGSHLPTKSIKLRQFSIPKFNISSKFEASRVLKELGISLIFDRNEAELSEMIEDSLDGGRLFVSEVHHKCFIKVDEEGTVAAASSTVALPMPQRMPPPLHFVADHPFMFIIRDNVNGVVLFMGYVLDPSLNS